MIIDITILAAIALGLTQVVKAAGLPKRFIPLVAIALGVGFNFLGKYVGVGYQEVILYGTMAGLSAVGLYDIGKKTIAGK